MEVFVDQSQTLTGIFFQDAEMRSNFHSFPEVVLVDATYKLTNLCMPVYLMLCIDGNGQSEIVACCVTSLETEDGMTAMADSFKKHNARWEKVAMVMTDKDMTERTVFGRAFPNATMHLCLFHVLRSFRRQITCEKFGITSGERDLVLDMMSRLTYARSLAKYTAVYDELMECGLETVIRYFNTNWHSSKDEWVEGLKGQVFSLGETTNNRLESTNAKVKSVCTKYATLENFFTNFVAVLAVLRGERSHRIVMSIITKTTCSDAMTQLIHKCLTPYAAAFVIQQRHLMEKVVMTGDMMNGVWHLESNEGELVVSPASCTCKFRVTMQLPCRHMFAVRGEAKMDLFCMDLAAERWSMSYLTVAHSMKASASTDASVDVSVAPEAPPSRTISSHQKYNRAFRVASALASLAAEVGMEEFEARLATLQDLHDQWSSHVPSTLILICNWEWVTLTIMCFSYMRLSC